MYRQLSNHHFVRGCVTPNRACAQPPHGQIVPQAMSSQQRHSASEHARRECSRLTLDQRGTVFAEYVTLLVFISVGCVAATIALGVPLTNLFLFQRAILLLPIP